MVDTSSRFSPVLDPPFRYRGSDVVRLLNKTFAPVGYPKGVRLDQGSAFVSLGLDLWGDQNKVLDLSRLGEAADNAFIEVFSGCLRTDSLNAHWFQTIADAQENLKDWRRYYNKYWPHGAIGNKLPILLQNRGGASSSLL